MMSQRRRDILTDTSFRAIAQHRTAHVALRTARLDCVTGSALTASGICSRTHGNQVLYWRGIFIGAVYFVRLG